jgi:hypothetical protein
MIPKTIHCISDKTMDVSTIASDTVEELINNIGNET